MPTTVPPIRILLVEDDDDYAGAVDLELSAAGMPARLRRSRSLAEASTLLPGDGFDVVLLDLGLPDSSGLDTLKGMQQAAAGIPIVVLTGENSDDLAIAAVQLGAEDYLSKNSTDTQFLSRALRYACERARSRLALRRSEEQLREAQRMEALGRLAGSVAHDFNNVLASIFGFSDLLLDQCGPEDPRRADVEEIRRSAERAAALTRQLLAFCRKQVRDPREIDLNELIIDLHALLVRLLGEYLQIDLSLAPELWTVRADPAQVEQVIINVCARARDATRERGLMRIRSENVVVDEVARQRDGLCEGAYARLTVADQGHGTFFVYLPRAGADKPRR